MEAVREKKLPMIPRHPMDESRPDRPGVIAVEGRGATMLQLGETLQRLLKTSVLDQIFPASITSGGSKEPTTPDYTAVVAASGGGRNWRNTKGRPGF
jgi:hypothetical protein